MVVLVGQVRPGGCGRGLKGSSSRRPRVGGYRDRGKGDSGKEGEKDPKTPPSTVPRPDEWKRSNLSRSLIDRNRALTYFAYNLPTHSRHHYDSDPFSDPLRPPSPAPGTTNILQSPTPGY